MVFKTYLSKMNSIIKGSDLNTSINPISELIYGKNITRVLCYFDHSKIKCMMEDGTMPDKSKITHRLKITNAGHVDFSMLHHKETSSIDSSIKKRASSFDLIFFLIPKTWDSGKGFDYTANALNADYYDTKPRNGNKLFSSDGCNWYQRRNGLPWDEEGVYSNKTLSDAYDKFASDEGSAIIFARQRFEVGAEDIDLDITEIVNKFVSGELENNGIGIAFTPALERLGVDENAPESLYENYIGFFTQNTNTFFEPYVETQYHDYISDDRTNFVLNKKNRLYLYCNIGGNLVSLDENPTVTITDSNEEVVNDADGNELKDITASSFSKGVYYIDVAIKGLEQDTMLYDTWSNIKYDGIELDNVELDFTLKAPNLFFNIKNDVEGTKRYTPSISGIKDSEDIFRFGDIRKVNVLLKENYTNTFNNTVKEIKYRIYVMDGEREITVIPYENVNKTFLEYYFILDTSILLPQKYYIDVRVSNGLEMLTYKDICHFNIVSSLDNRYA